MKIYYFPIVAALLINSSCEKAKIEKESIPKEVEVKLSSSEAIITSSNNKSSVYINVEQPAKHDVDGMLYFSIEVPKEQSIEKTEAFVNTTGSDGDKGERINLKPVDKTKVGVTFPPGPDDSTDWKVFGVDITQKEELSSNKLTVTFNLSELIESNFTRIIIGKPASNNSKMIGAFTERVKTDGVIIKKGTDLLGTVSAVQYMQFPSDLFGNGSKAYAGLVTFKDLPIGKDLSNADTEMIRTRDIPANGGTSPIILTKFNNTTVEPIQIETEKGPINVTVTATLSPNAKSHGFITVDRNGTYKSTTTLFPILTLQQVDEAGNPTGAPVTIDTAKEQIPGYPFYLASNGGKWTETAPEGRLVLESSSNFFYNNGQVNNFIHSNGGAGIGTLGKCAKASVNQING